MRTIYPAHRIESGLALWAVVYASFKGNKKNVRWVLALVVGSSRRPCVVCRSQTEIKIKSEKERMGRDVWKQKSEKSRNLKNHLHYTFTI